MFSQPKAFFFFFFFFSLLVAIQAEVPAPLVTKRTVGHDVQRVSSPTEQGNFFPQDPSNVIV
jgi:hypothetical protein